ncbi:MAG: TetR family transcriptional regulator C-terminal domain-containing protein [Clostridia bacterium]|nr:TetR family transcriptional regulator C-terminal domain-containing protein [Clostridia bacterium]
MNTKNNQRTRISKMLLKNALLDLLAEKKSVEKISVRELSEKAELNRSTFYAHYGEPKDLLDETEDEVLAAAAEHLFKIGKANDKNAADYMLSFLRYIKSNDKAFRILLVDAADSGFRTKFIRESTGRIVESFDITLQASEEQYIYSYILNGSSSVVIQWIRSGYAIDEAALVELLFRMNKYLLEGVMGEAG